MKSGSKLVPVLGHGRQSTHQNGPSLSSKMVRTLIVFGQFYTTQNAHMPGRASKRSFSLYIRSKIGALVRPPSSTNSLWRKLSPKWSALPLKVGLHLPFKVAFPSPQGGPPVCLKVDRQPPQCRRQVVHQFGQSTSPPAIGAIWDVWPRRGPTVT